MMFYPGRVLVSLMLSTSMLPGIVRAQDLPPAVFKAGVDMVTLTVHARSGYISGPSPSDR